MCILLQYFSQYNLICNSLREKVCLVEENSSMYTSVKFDFIMKTACPKNEKCIHLTKSINRNN